MTRDLPDWGAQSSQATVHEVTDLGELAVRLGSIVTHDRRGDVIWFDGFEDGLVKWATATFGTGAAVDLSLTKARNGLFAARLVAGSDGGLSARIDKTIPFPVLSPMGAEFSFQLQQNIDNLEFIFDLFDGVDVTQYLITWSDVANNLLYQDSAGVDQVFASDVSLSITDTLFHTMKLVVDMENKVYARLIIDNTTYLLTDIAALAIADVTTPAVRVRMNLIGRAGDNDLIYVDDVILTQNENV
ncbi:hypothetical protein LCGC14_2666380 [marine sediment metagenome]|uniref:Uncharacterized protein n=1 Tax=marine sediment metagenome TaxID=412755 RepID=A0A0F9CHB2_9ZZZZ